MLLEVGSWGQRDEAVSSCWSISWHMCPLQFPELSASLYGALHCYCGTFMQKTHLSPALTLLNNGHKKCQWEVCIEGIKFRPHKWSLTSSVWVGKPSTSAGQGEPSRLLIPTSYYCRLPLYLILWKIWLISKTVDNQQKVRKPSIYKICFALHLCFIRNL